MIKQNKNSKLVFKSSLLVKKLDNRTIKGTEMITREQLEAALDDETKASFVTKDIDHDVVAINLLRERIPYSVCYNIIQGAGYETLYLCDVEKALPYLTEYDLVILADCNCLIDEDNDCIALFV